MSWWYGREYESVDQKRRKAEKLVAQLRKKNPDIKPVCIEGKTLAKSFWGKAWCKQMDLMADHDNRLPRGRSYARNGAICHLEIRRGEVEAWVSGTQMYTVRIHIKPLSPAHWKSIQAACRGKIATLLDLLRGKLSKEVMTVVSDPETGIFPKPGEISYDCSCPDWAHLCKHVAAVFYGVGSRLDEEPELLFLLRHVDPVELFSLDVAAPAATNAESPLRDADLGSLFGIELMEEAAPVSQPAMPKDGATPVEPRAHASRAKETAKNGKGAQQPPAMSVASATRNQAGKKTRNKTALLKKTKVKTGSPGLPALDIAALTGPDIAALREAAGLSPSLFASRLGLSQATVLRWEKEPGIVRMFPASRRKLQGLYKKLLREK